MKKYLPYIGIAIVLIAAILLIMQANTPNIPETDPDIYKQVDNGDVLEDLADHLVSGGPPPDGIPPIEEPEFIAVSDVDFLEDEDRVFIAERNGIVKIYPQSVLVWHEIVNDEFAGEHASITYCPLTGTVIGMENELEDGSQTDFGTSGSLVNSNLVMYDRDSGSYWPQIARKAVTGERTGEELGMFPVIWSSWEKASVEFPDAFVLTEETGFLRNYNNDPYGSYTSGKGYYVEGPPLFATMHTDNRLTPKTVVLGVYDEDGEIAFVKESVKIQGSMTQRGYTAHYIESLDAVEVVIEGTDEHADFVEGFWFAWSSFFPNTDLFE